MGGKEEGEYADTVKEGEEDDTVEEEEEEGKDETRRSSVASGARMEWSYMQSAHRTTS